MDVQNFSYNPFSLSHATNAWNNNGDSTSVKIFKTIQGATYDILLQNPYNLSIGNCKKWMNSSNPLPLTTKVAIITTVIFSSFYTLMLYGTLTHLQGRAAISLGNKVGLDALVKVGEALKTFGKQLFLSGAVPVYGIFYAGPKYFIQSLPKVAQFIAEKISLAAEWVFDHVLAPIWNNTIVPLWNHVIVPIYNAIDTAVRFVASQISNAVIAVVEGIEKLVQFIFTNVLTPLWEVLYPILKGIGEVIQFIGRKIESIIINIGSAIEAAVSFIDRVVTQVARFVFENLLLPIWKLIMLPINALQCVVKWVGNCLSEVAEVTKQAATFVFQRLIVPVFNFLHNYIVQPLTAVLSFVADKITDIALAVFQYTIAPLLKAVKISADAISTCFWEINREIAEGIYYWWGLRPL